MASQTSQRKSHVFRVTGLSRDLPDEDLQASLQRVLNENFTSEERSQIKTEITIVPSCYDPDQERVALVQFRGGVPQLLSELTLNPLGDWQVEMDDSDISFDCHFFGFTQLYTPDGKEPVIADIIAIAGLDGHAYGSWQGRGNLGRMWLRDFLSKDLPQCRTMIYGYNSKLSSHGVDTILDYGRELMEEIKKIRNTKELQERPLFFIAHSFGGIILAHCLVRAIQTMDKDHPAITSLHRATYGMMFFGIPLKGLVVEDIQQMLAGDGKHPREKLLQQISRQSDLLTHQLADFKNLIRDRKVVSFYEREQTRRLVLDTASGRWKRTGDFITTVDADSALLQLPDHVEDKVPLHTDHSMMVKFDTRNAAGYRTTLNKLQKFAKDAPAVVTARFTQARHRPQPCSTVPFKKDSMFVGREDVIGAVSEKHAAIGQHHERVALVGLAGVGKTQTAIEYAYRARESALDMWVFWIHASNAARLEEGYQRIAAVAEIPRRDDPKTNILQLVYQWLCDESNGRWLMVLDNADDDQIFFRSDDAGGRASLVTFLPQATHGSVLITSRSGLAARNLVGTDGLVIDVLPMNEAESLALLRMRIPDSQSPAEDEVALVQALEYIPLAITQVGAYIANRSPLITVSAYLRLFRESETKRIRLLQNEESIDLRRDPSIRYAVIATWQLSFEEIQRQRPAATDLLALMSMFDRQGIPEDLVRNDEDILDFHDALTPLLNYSLIRMETDSRVFDMHRLVQLSVRAWLERHQRLRGWQAKSRRIMAQVFPNGNHETWTRCRLLLAHARSVLEVTGSIDSEDQLNLATLLSKCGWFLGLQGGYEEARDMHRQALEMRESILGPEHLDTLISVSYLGSVLDSQGQYEDAEAMHQRAMEGFGKVIGLDNSSTFTSASNLSLVLDSQGKYQEAEVMQQQALEIWRKVVKHEHPTALTKSSILGLLLHLQGEYREAEAMHRQALEGFQKVLGPEHPTTIASVCLLGVLLQSQGKYNEAEAEHRRGLAGSERVLGLKHSDTLTSANSLGLVLENQGKYEEAERMYRRALEGFDKVFGPEHLFTITSMSSVGLTLDHQGKCEEAEAMYQLVLGIQERVLGPDDTKTLINVTRLGSVLDDQEKYEEAERMYRRALEGFGKVFGLEHLSTLNSMNCVGLMLQRQGKYKEAEAMYRRALEGFEKVLGSESPFALTTIRSIGSVLESQEEYEDAEVMYRQALEGFENIFGPDCASTVTTVHSVGSVLDSQGKYEEAEAMHRRALGRFEKVLGPEHPYTITSANILADFLQEH